MPELAPHDSANLDAFLKCIKPWELAYAAATLSFIALKEPSGLAVVHGHLLLPNGWVPREDTIVETNSLVAGCFRLDAASLTVDGVLRGLCESGLDTSFGRLYVPTEHEGKVSTYFNPWKTGTQDGEARTLAFALNGKRHPLGHMEVVHMAELRASVTPYASLDELAVAINGLPLRRDVSVVDITAANCVQLDGRRRVKGTTANPAVLLASNLEREKVGLGLSIHSRGKAAQRYRYDGDALHWSEGENGIWTGELEVTVEEGSAVQCFASYGGSPLFTGDAGGGESEIRRHILELDYLDCIVALPTDMFYNTNIATYLWFMTNRKPPARKGKVLLIDASGMSVLMNKNLGKKRRKLTDDCVERISGSYAAFKTMDWRDDATGRSLKAKVLDRKHFFYRKITIERPLRMRFRATPEGIALLRTDKAYTKLPEEQISLLAAALNEMDPSAIFVDAESFRAALKDAAKTAAENKGLDGKKAKLAAKPLELARKYLGTKDKNAEPTTNERGEILPDSELRDAEYVPFDEDIDAYFDREVTPHWLDAWINRDVKDEKDELTGIVGTEINFNREFYVYKPPRSREAIKADIESMENRFMELLRGVSK
ncbi:hypothetical protein BJN34_01275 [Cupriavidus necator]|uniref:site-specific DNA-methyltransferase (adenine-specific) n=1 Tax=Cupriavidus necator TaxID=106590 RepID=A0A1U9UJB9_CUPNE|nr:N-6 DNA methylase [Cupriavidus necator]AQV92527.1 hypothetical protein BJN34_01275 [Cupriavidus necator]